jgi:isoleucyl-tRNA synthetase
MPFVSDTIYVNLTKEVSVHLASWPEKSEVTDSALTSQMAYIRQVTELAHSKRKDEKIAVRQPLLSLTVASDKEQPKKELLEILADELNVKEVIWQSGETLSVTLDTTITPELEAEAKARELVRMIQGARKEAGTAMDDQIIVSLPEWPKEHEDFIRAKTLIRELSVGEFSVKKAS